MLAQNYRRCFLTLLISFEKGNIEMKNNENLYRIARIYMRSCWGFVGKSISDLTYNLLRRNMVEMWKCRKSFDGNSSHRISTESVNGPLDTWKKWRVPSLLWKMRLTMGISLQLYWKSAMQNTCSSPQSGVVWRLQAGRSGLRIPTRTRNLYLLHNGTYSASCFNG